MKKNIINLFSIGLTAVLILSACSDSFLEEKKNYDNVSTDIYNYYSGCNARINDLYSWCLPNVNGAAGGWQYNSTGNKDNQSGSTEEYSGFTVFVDPVSPMTVMSGGGTIPDFFQGQVNNIQASCWGRIRNVNDVIKGISDGSLSEDEKNELLGQAYFFRAWCYYNIVKWYGGIPIVTDVLDPTEDAVTPRSSTKACIEFILSDLDKSAKMLAPSTMDGGWKSSDDWGRVTTGTALALKGRVLLLWASPIFNRANDQTRWTNAYSTMKTELDSINACGYSLYSTSSNINGSDFAKMFTQSTKNPEAVFVTLYNTVLSGDGQKNNSWERYIRPKNSTGSGLKPSAMLIDEFPMADGKRPSTCNTYTKLTASDSIYDSSYPFVARDPRFYRTFAFPGVRWAYSGDPTQIDANNPSYDKGTNYELWNYVWYTSTSDAGDVESGSAYAADNLLTNNSGVYVRKRSDDYDVNSSPLYSWQATDQNGGFAYSAASYIELRYAEVLLNYAEAACGAGELDDAVAQIQKVRARAGYTADNNYGLQSNLSSDQASCMSAILYERQIEFAYEGKRFDDCRRWLLYDGGANFSSIDGAPSTWTLTGWGGNTCTWLGFTPLNGQRRENMEFRTADKYGVGGTTIDSDPLVTNSVTRCSALDYRNELSSQTATLKAWYEGNLVRKLKKGDAYDSNKVEEYMDFLPRYYLLGFTSGIQDQNKTLPQTIGWEDYENSGANGTFDPLAE
jgi:starch-binding outer membrane protein, SusD/RagB family